MMDFSIPLTDILLIRIEKLGIGASMTTVGATILRIHR